MTEILDEPLDAIAGALRSGTTTAEQLTATAIDRHDRWAKSLLAYQAWDPERALADARAADTALRAGSPLGPLGGMPVSVKDLYGVSGYPTFAGTAQRLPAKWEQEGFLFRRLREQQIVVIGKTQTVELAFGGLGTNPNWGTPVNPWDAETIRVPGGSSCGAGVSLSEGSAVIALGTDTAASIRTPASMTGTVGLKSTYGRWPADGVVPLSPTLDTVGGLTRTVADMVYFFGSVDPEHGDPKELLLSLEDVNLAGIRIGVGGTSVWAEAQPDIVDVAEATLAELEGHGARLVELDLPEFDAAYHLYMQGAIVPPECGAFVARELPGWLDLLDETVARRLREGEAVTARQYLGALAERRELAATADVRLQAVDVLATPTVPITPPALDEVQEIQAYLRLNRLTSRATNPVNMLDLCAISMPCGLDAAGMPVGLQLVARNGQDERLLGIGWAAERLLGTPIQRLGGSPPRLD